MLVGAASRIRSQPDTCVLAPDITGMTIRALLLPLVLLLAAWFPTPQQDLTSLAYKADAVVIAKRIGSLTTAAGLPISRYQVVQALDGNVTGTIDVSDAMYAVFSKADDTRLLFLAQLTPDQQQAHKQPEWVALWLGVRVVIGGVVHDFVAQDARGYSSGTFVDGNRSVMMPVPQTREDPAVDQAKPGPVGDAELLETGRRAVTRARELRSLLAQKPSVARRTRLLALLPAKVTRWTERHGGHDKLTLDFQVMRAFAESEDIEGILQALPRIRVLPDEVGWAEVVSRFAMAGNQPDALRVRALQALAAETTFTTHGFISDASVAVRRASATIATTATCIGKWAREDFTKARKTEQDPGVRDLIDRALKLKRCRE
jgi:hypothetical protein